MCRKAGRPLPTFSTDDVLDFMVTEALVVKEALLEEKEIKAQKRAEWKKDPQALKDLAARAG